MATSDPLAPLAAALNTIQSDVAAAKVASDKLIVDIQTLLAQAQSGAGTVTVNQATLNALISQAQTISASLKAETAAEAASDATVNPPAPPAPPAS